MSPRKPVKALYDFSLEIVIKCLRKYLEKKVEKINFFNDFDAAAREFLSRCRDGRDFIADHFIGPLRWKILDHFLSVSLENVVRVAGYLILQASVYILTSLVHSHWSRNVEARLSLVESFPSDACASNLKP